MSKGMPREQLTEQEEDLYGRTGEPEEEVETEELDVEQPSTDAPDTDEDIDPDEILIPIETKDGVKNYSYTKLIELAEREAELGKGSGTTDPEAEAAKVALAEFKASEVAVAAAHWRRQGYSDEQIIDALHAVLEENRKAQNNGQEPTNDVEAIRAEIEKIQSTIQSDRTQREHAENARENDVLLYRAIEELGVDFDYGRDLQTILRTAEELYPKTSMAQDRLTERQARLIIQEAFRGSPNGRADAGSTTGKRKISKETAAMLRTIPQVLPGTSAAKVRTNSRSEAPVAYRNRGERLRDFYKD